MGTTLVPSQSFLHPGLLGRNVVRCCTWDSAVSQVRARVQQPPASGQYTQGALPMSNHPRQVVAASAQDATAPTASLALPVLQADEVIARLRSASHAGTSTFRAMYSSVVGGIILDPAAMVLPIDDHMVHRGHGVFDTAVIFKGHLYELDPHLDRILRSASKARITPPFPREALHQILIDTAAASDCTVGHIRFWLSTGPGGFGLSPKECPATTFYAMVISEKTYPDAEAGVKVITSSIPIKPPQFATMKSTNYMPNALLAMAAEDVGAYTSIWLDQEGFIAEGPSMNVAFVGEDDVLLVPPFDKILAGLTMRRAITLAPQLMSDDDSNGMAGGDGLIKGVRVAPVTVEEARRAKEMMLVGSGTLVTPVVQWDGKPVGDGKSGPVALRLREIMMSDMEGGIPTADRIKIPYRSLPEV